MAIPAERLETRLPDLKPALTDAQARAEAGRCLFCHDAPCVEACPTHIDIPLFIKQIHTHNLVGSARTIFEANALGHSCARVCPVEVLCVGSCVYNAKGEPPIMIGRLQRHATDHVVAGGIQLFEAGSQSGFSVACVGGGPASIACAHELVRFGHRAVIFEQSAYPGGLNTDGVAPYKMQADEALREAEWLSAIGIEWRLGADVGGGDLPWSRLEEEYDAVFLGLGLGPDARLEVPGEDLFGVWGASALIEAIKTGMTVDPSGIRSAVVVGGGNTAIDAARELALLGVPDVRLAYRRGPDRMPGYAHEREHAVHEGVRFLWNVLPVAFLGNGRLEGVRMTRLDDALNPVGEPWDEAADVAALAVGQGRLTELLAGIADLRLERGRVVVDPETGRTTNSRYWAGGDLANGGAEVVNAAAEGKRAARGIDAWLRSTAAAGEQ